MGIDVLLVLPCGGQTLQFSAKGMDPRELKRRFRDRLCFEGGVSVQTTLPFGTVEDVRSEVEALIAVLGEGGISSIHRTLSRRGRRSPPQGNVVAMFDTAASFYPF